MNANEKLNALLQDEAFGEACKTVESAEQLQKLFAENGVELTVAEVESLCQQINVFAGEGELDAEALDHVAGGARIFLPISPSFNMQKVARKIVEMLFGKKKYL